jgi:hypothetical protein
MATFSRRPAEQSPQAREILIHAKHWPTAQRALNLMFASIHLESGEPPVFESELIAHNDTEPVYQFGDIERVCKGTTLSCMGIPLACAIAAKASRNLKYTYAITQYEFSISLYSQHGMDLEPHYSPHLHISTFPDDHVRFSHAVIAAYAAIENVGLEVRASKKKPSRKGGKWNPVVKKELEARLGAAGIDLGEDILWTVRGPVRKPEKERGVPPGTKEPWAAGMVRDCSIGIVDAIAYSSWFRSRVASHKANELTRAISPYDVINVQHTARRLILESLGFWRWYSVQKK